MYKDILTEVPLFSGLAESQLQRLQNISSKKKFEREQIIFNQDEQAKGFYIVLQGRIKVFKISPEGREQILHIFGRGEPVGEAPVFSGGTFPAHAQALEKSELLFLPREKLRELFTQDPSLAMNMLAVLSARLREFTGLIEDLSLKELPARLAAYLMHLQDHSGGEEQVTLDISKGNLAKFLGTSQETLSRVLRKMSDAGIIQVDRKTISILQDGALEDLAHGYSSLP